MSTTEHVIARIDAVLAEPDMVCLLPTCGESTFGWLSSWCSPRCQRAYRGDSGIVEAPPTWITEPTVVPALDGSITWHGWAEEHFAAQDTAAAEDLVAELLLPPAPVTFSAGAMRLVDVEAIERELEQAHAVTRPSPVRRVLNRITRRSA